MTSTRRKSTFWLFHVTALLFYMRRSELWPAAAVVNVQVIPVNTVTTRAQFTARLSSYTEVFGQALLLLFGSRIGARHKTHTHTRKRNPKTNDCNVESCVIRCHLYCEFCSIWFYVSNVRLYIRLWVLNLYINSCVLKFYGFVFFCTWDVFGECEPFFLKRDFLQKHEHHRTKLLFTKYSTLC